MTTMAGTVYECPSCGELTTDRRCPDCHLFTRRRGPGGPCPHCDELVLITDLTTTATASTAYTENLTGSAITVAACLDRLADTPLSVPPDGLPAQGRTVDARRADALVGLAATVLDAFDAYSTADTGPERDPDPDPDADADADADSDADPRAEQPRGVTVALGAASHAVDTRAEKPDGIVVAVSDEQAAVAAVLRAVSAPVRAAGPATSTGPGGAPRRVSRVRRSAEIRVTVSAETLLGVNDHPGELSGWGPITASHARRLARRAGTVWRRILTDPVSGAVLDIGRTRYPPGATITEHVLARDGGRCTRLGCSHAARDLDHARAWADGGRTAAANLHAVCRGCHSVKHLGWTVTVAPDGTITWETPPRAPLPTAPTRPAPRRSSAPATRTPPRLDHRPHHRPPPRPNSRRIPTPERPGPPDRPDRPPRTPTLLSSKIGLWSGRLLGRPPVP